MTDDRLQALRRAWNQGDFEVRAQLLRERVRAGELSEERAWLVGWLGGVAVERSSSSPAFEDWLERLVSPSVQVEIRQRVVVAGANACLPLWDPSLQSPLPTEILEPPPQVQTFHIGSVCHGTPDAGVTRSCSPIRGVAVAEELLLEPDSALADLLAAEADALMHFARGVGEGRRIYGAVARAIAYTLRTVRGEVGCTERACEHALSCLGRGRFKEAVVRDVLPWALGFHDPIVERVLGRR